MRNRLLTIGYTGFSIDGFVEHLQASMVDVLVDVRELPMSRKRGFSKTALACHLDGAGIEYVHLRWLGSPRALRHRVRETGDYETFFAGVHQHLRGELATGQLVEAMALARKRRACLMCCCEDWQFCHRRCVVEAMTGRLSFSVDHLRTAGSRHLAA